MDPGERGRVHAIDAEALDVEHIRREASARLRERSECECRLERKPKERRWVCRREREREPANRHAVDRLCLGKLRWVTVHPDFDPVTIVDHVPRETPGELLHASDLGCESAWKENDPHAALRRLTSLSRLNDLT